mgnify:CR=1 FL=1
MSMKTDAGTATILPFPAVRPFSSLQPQHDGVPRRPVVVETSSAAWYHEEAVRDATPKGSA